MKCKQSCLRFELVLLCPFRTTISIIPWTPGFTVRSRKNCKPLFSVGIVLPLEFWNHTFHPIRMTHAILPGHTSLGTIKGSAKHMRPLFSFLIPHGWQIGKTSQYERYHFSLQLGTIPTADRDHLERAHFNICSSAYLRRLFPGQLFLPPKPNGPDASG